MLKDILATVIAGLEHTGTTFTEEIVMASPQVEMPYNEAARKAGGSGALEGGIFLSNDPQHLDPFSVFRPNYDHFHRRWGVRMEEFQAESYEQVWWNIRERMPGFVLRNRLAVDKCPAYMRCLPELLQRTEDLPIVIVRKHPFNWAASMMSRGWTIDRIIKKYRHAYCDVVPKVQKEYGNRVMVLQFEDFTIDPYKTAFRLYDFLGLDFDIDFLKGLMSGFDPSRVNKAIPKEVEAQLRKEVPEFTECPGSSVGKEQQPSKLMVGSSNLSRGAKRKEDKMTKYKVGDWVIYKKRKDPVLRSEQVWPEGEECDFQHCIVTEVDGTTVIAKTRTGKRVMFSTIDPRGRKAHWYEKMTKSQRIHWVL